MTDHQTTQLDVNTHEINSEKSQQKNLNWSWKRVLWLLVWLAAMSILTVLYIQDKTGQGPPWPWESKTEIDQKEMVATTAGELRPDLRQPSKIPSPAGQIDSSESSEIASSIQDAHPPNSQQVILTIEPTPILVKKNPASPTFPSLSNSDILAELNSYRAAHKIPALIENQLLCQYAEKRVQDLVVYGGLDNHAGFIRDTENYDTLPDSLQNYPGGTIGENLAYQYCKNMTTGDSFIASTPQQLIEWCFDSSTRGHREAQLNPKYTAACVRNQEGYVVVIFGE